MSVKLWGTIRSAWFGCEHSSNMRVTPDWAPSIPMRKTALQVVLRNNPKLPSELETDEHIPLRFRTFRESVACGYLRLGNYSSTLLELKIELFSQTLRGLTLTSAPPLTPWPRFEIVERTVGLPTLSTHFDDIGILDLDLDFQVSVKEDAILVHWISLSACEACRFGCADFLIQEGTLSGVHFGNTHQDQLVQFLAHFPGSKRISAS